MTHLLHLSDIIIVPLLLVLVILWAAAQEHKYLEEYPYYRYYKRALMIKVGAGLFFALIYMFYYGGGDTLYYFKGTENIVRLFRKDMGAALQVLLGDRSWEVYAQFDGSTGYPTYWRDPNSFAVCRFNIFFYLLSFGSFLGNTILMSTFMFLGIWQFYKMLMKLYPNQDKWMAYALFYIPSVAFWSSGLLKDGWTLTAIALILTYLHKLLIERNFSLLTLLWLFIWSYILFAIRPFMLYAVLASGLVWLGFANVGRIKSAFLRTVAVPLVVLVLFVVGSSAIASLGAVAGDRYEDIDTMLETAAIIQNDLKQDYYGGNSFDIGSFEPTLAGALKMAPKAVIAGMFRPYLWEARSPLMLFSGLENFALLIAFLLLGLRYRKYRFFKQTLNDPFILSIFILALTYSFAVGLTTSNFGALVRYVIPATMLMGIVAVRAFTRSS